MAKDCTEQPKNDLYYQQMSWLDDYNEDEYDYDYDHDHYYDEPYEEYDEYDHCDAENHDDTKTEEQKKN